MSASAGDTAILAAIVDGQIATGATPPAQAISETTGLHVDYVRRVLRRLVDDGALAQPYGDRGPYVPLRRSDGTPVAVRLVDMKAEAEQDVLVELVGKLPAEKRAEVERFIRFVLEGGG